MPVEARGRADDAPGAHPRARRQPSQCQDPPLVAAAWDAGRGRLRRRRQHPALRAPEGTEPRAPRLRLLLYGGLDVLPWGLQYVLNAGRFVGRLHLTGEPFANYVSVLLGGWSGSAVRYDQPVVWLPTSAART